MNIKHLCVLIPAKNEDKLLPRCLHSIFKASSVIPQLISVDIILCVDSSTDNTMALGKKIIGTKGRVLEINKRNVGFARKFAAIEALKRFRGALECCWLANTDADCEVPVDWLKKQLFWAEKGIEAIAGIVKVDSFVEHDVLVPQFFKKEYLIHSDGTHPHIHGANLGIRADVYQKVGGWNPLPTAEDHDLWSRLIASNFKLISSADLFVMTSGRKQGRAPHGFAEKLASYNGKKHEKF